MRAMDCRLLAYYAVADAAMNLAAFAVALGVQRERGSVDLDAFAGLGRLHPSCTAAVVVAFLSLLGLPAARRLRRQARALQGRDRRRSGMARGDRRRQHGRVAVLLPAGHRPDRARAARRSSCLRRRDGAAGARPCLAATLAVTAVATVGFGVAAEPLLAVAARATMLGG